MLESLARAILHAYVSHIETHLAIANFKISLKTMRTESEKKRWITRLANATRMPIFVVRKPN